MIKIGFVIDTIYLPTGGTEKQLLKLIRGLDRTRFTPYLIVLRESEWMKSEKFDFVVKNYKVKRLLSLATLGKIRDLARFCREVKLDIVQTFFPDGNVFGTIGAHWGGGSVIISSRRNIGHWQRWRDRLILKFLRRWTDYYIANSKAAAHKAIEQEGIEPGKLTVIYNGINLEKIESIDEDKRRRQREAWGIKDDEKLIGALANLRNVKNIDSMIQAAEIITAEYPNTKFVVVGDGPERQRLNDLIAKAGLSQRFLLAGIFRDVDPCLAAMDIAVLPSAFESFSNSLIEYMAAGLPIAATDVGGNSEAITHEREGLLYPSGDVEKLVKALRKLLSDPNFAGNLGENAKRKAFAKYSRSNYLTEHEGFYENAVRNFKKSQGGF